MVWTWRKCSKDEQVLENRQFSPLVFGGAFHSRKSRTSLAKTLRFQEKSIKSKVLQNPSVYRNCCTDFRRSEMSLSFYSKYNREAILATNIAISY